MSRTVLVKTLMAPDALTSGHKIRVKPDKSNNIQFNMWLKASQDNLWYFFGVTPNCCKKPEIRTASLLEGFRAHEQPMRQRNLIA